jgi:hypothetical protein
MKRRIIARGSSISSSTSAHTDSGIILVALAVAVSGAATALAVKVFTIDLIRRARPNLYFRLLADVRDAIDYSLVISVFAATSAILILTMYAMDQVKGYISALPKGNNSNGAGHDEPTPARASIWPILWILIVVIAILLFLIVRGRFSDIIMTNELDVPRIWRITAPLLAFALLAILTWPLSNTSPKFRVVVRTHIPLLALILLWVPLVILGPVLVYYLQDIFYNLP